MLHTIENKSLPSRAAKAAEMVRQSVVRVRGFGDVPKDPKTPKGETIEKEVGVGSGVVILENGIPRLETRHYIQTHTMLEKTGKAMALREHC